MCVARVFYHHYHQFSIQTHIFGSLRGGGKSKGDEDASDSEEGNSSFWLKLTYESSPTRLKEGDEEGVDVCGHEYKTDLYMAHLTPDKYVARGIKISVFKQNLRGIERMGCRSVSDV